MYVEFQVACAAGLNYTEPSLMKQVNFNSIIKEVLCLSVSPVSSHKPLFRILL